jgi:hypothetical protein
MDATSVDEVNHLLHSLETLLDQGLMVGKLEAAHLIDKIRTILHLNGTPNYEVRDSNSVSIHVIYSISFPRTMQEPVHQQSPLIWSVNSDGDYSLLYVFLLTSVCNFSL